MIERVVVVGAGLAGGRAVEALREAGYDGELALVGAEEHLPYDRPPLSKEFLIGEVDDTALRAPDAYDDLRLELHLGRQAAELRNDLLVLDDGSELAFDAAILATGARPRRLPGTDHLAGVHVLRTIDDARAIRADLDASPRVVVAGAGFIGAEVASSCRARGLDVVVLEALQQPLERVLGSEVGAWCASCHRDEGVDLRLNVAVEQLLGDRRVESVVLADGTVVPADVVIVGIGVVPETSFLAGSGVVLNNGVEVDEHLATAMPDVFAVGDLANAWNPLLDERVRVEHWTNAAQGAEIAASNVLGRNEVFAPVPYFWSDQYGMKLQYVGHCTSWDDLVVRGDPSERKFDAFYLADGRVRAALCVGRPRDTVAAERLIASGVRPDRRALGDPDVGLMSLAT